VVVAVGGQDAAVEALVERPPPLRPLPRHRPLRWGAPMESVVGAHHLPGGGGDRLTAVWVLVTWFQLRQGTKARGNAANQYGALGLECKTMIPAQCCLHVHPLFFQSSV